MNRRRLVIVVVLAALFGAVLPYLQLVLIYAFPSGDQPEEFPRLRKGIINQYGVSTPVYDRVVLEWFGGSLDDQRRKLAVEACYGLVPDNSMDIFNASRAGVSVTRIGWPFRAAHFCYVLEDAGPIRVGETSTVKRRGDTGYGWLNEHAPPDLPLGVLCGGAIANTFSATLLITCLYGGAAHRRARHRIKRGKCWKCGYLSHGAAVCPECGAGVKA